MSDPLIRACDNYLVLEPGQREEILNIEDTLKWLENWLEKMDELPKDLQEQPSRREAAHRLLDTACDLEISPGMTLQWYAVRLDPPSS